MVSLPITSFPDEVLLNIFSFLPSKDLGRVSQVCKSWQILIEDNVLWSNYLHNKLDRSIIPISPDIRVKQIVLKVLQFKKTFKTPPKEILLPPLPDDLPWTFPLSYSHPTTAPVFLSRPSSGLLMALNPTCSQILPFASEQTYRYHGRSENYLFLRSMSHEWVQIGDRSVDMAASCLYFMPLASVDNYEMLPHQISRIDAKETLTLEERSDPRFLRKQKIIAVFEYAHKIITITKAGTIAIWNPVDGFHEWHIQAFNRETEPLAEVSNAYLLKHFLIIKTVKTADQNNMRYCNLLSKEWKDQKLKAISCMSNNEFLFLLNSSEITAYRLGSSEDFNLKWNHRFDDKGLQVTRFLEKATHRFIILKCLPKNKKPWFDIFDVTSGKLLCNIPKSTQIETLSHPYLGEIVVSFFQSIIFIFRPDFNDKLKVDLHRFGIKNAEITGITFTNEKFRVITSMNKAWEWDLVTFFEDIKPYLHQAKTIHAPQISPGEMNLDPLLERAPLDAQESNEPYNQQQNELEIPFQQHGSSPRLTLSEKHREQTEASILQAAPHLPDVAEAEHSFIPDDPPMEETPIFYSSSTQEMADEDEIMKQSREASEQLDEFLSNLPGSAADESILESEQTQIPIILSQSEFLGTEPDDEELQQPSMTSSIQEDLSKASNNDHCMATFEENFAIAGRLISTGVEKLKESVNSFIQKYISSQTESTPKTSETTIQWSLPPEKQEEIPTTPIPEQEHPIAELKTILSDEEIQTIGEQLQSSSQALQKKLPYTALLGHFGMKV